MRRLGSVREQRVNVLALANSFLAHHAAHFGKPTPRLTPAARQVLLRHNWPGNVRELRSTIEQAVLLCADETLDEPLMTLRPLPADASPPPSTAATPVRFGHAGGVGT